MIARFAPPPLLPPWPLGFAPGLPDVVWCAYLVVAREDCCLALHPAVWAFTVTPDSVEVLDDEADLVVWDGFAGVLVTAHTGETWVRGQDENGVEIWETNVLDPVVSLDDMGWRESIAVMVVTETGNGIWVLDSNTGEGEVEIETPTGGEDLVASDNGRNIAVVTEEEVHFMEFERHAP